MHLQEVLGVVSQTESFKVPQGVSYSLRSRVKVEGYGLTDREHLLLCEYSP